MTPPAEDTPNEQPAKSPEIVEEPSATFDVEAVPSEVGTTSLDEDTSFSFGPGRDDVTIDLEELDRNFDKAADEITDLESRFEIGEVLGRGGMGTVRRAFDRRLGRDVAIKRINHKRKASRIAIRRFMTEGRSLALLNHLNIVQVHDYGEATDGPFIVMEYVGGGSLAETLEGGALELERVIELGCQLCEAIGVAHQAGIIHRDIKPANVLMTAEGVPKLTDFGLARQETVDGGQTQAGVVLGTLDFMPPEQKVDATKTDARSDLWSVGATIYQMVTGEIPRVIDLDEVPRTIRGVLARALKSQPEARYQSAEEFREALRDVRPDSTPATSEGVLAEGECPSCGTTNNSSRKFCRERECAAPLRVSCLSCEEQVSVWDEVCGECGGKQAELLEQRRSSMQEQRDEAEVLGRQYEYEKARTLVEQIRSEPDVRLQQLQDWATGFLESLASEESAQQERVAGLLRQTGQHRGSYDYASAEQTLEQIPEPLRTSETSDLLVEMERSKVESSELLATIRERIGNKDLEGLLDQVTRALELLPDRQDLQKIKGQLKEREEREKKATLTVAIAEQFLADENFVGLDEFTEIDEAAAESLSKHEGRLGLTGLTSLSDAAAESLSKHKGGRLSLNGLTSLSDAATESLSNHKGGLWLNGLTSLSDAAAESLSKHKYGLNLDGLTNLSDEAAESLSKHERILTLNGLTSLSDAATESLSKHKGGLWLDSLTSLSDAAAESLSKHKGELWLNALTSLSDEAAESLSKHEGELSLDGLTSLSDEAAESLSRHEGELSLKLDNLPASAADILRQRPSFQDEDDDDED